MHLELPRDLSLFLQELTQLDYNRDECEAGSIRLLPLNALRIELFPTDVDNGPIDNTADPHHRQLGCYLVPAVSLLSDCENFDPSGLLLWFPTERCYGTWDSSHTLLEVFSSDVTWSDIAGDPVRYLNAFWGDPIGGLTPLIPWPKYAYDPTQPHWPRPLTPTP